MQRINEANRRRLAPFVCVECRRSFKRPQQAGVRERPCPLCGRPATQVSQKFKPPPAGDLKQWHKVGLLLAGGVRFQTVYNSAHQAVPYPATAREVPAWLKQWGRTPGVAQPRL